jgi:hypothetical protein
MRLHEHNHATGRGNDEIYQMTPSSRANAAPKGIARAIELDQENLALSRSGVKGFDSECLKCEEIAPIRALAA